MKLLKLITFIFIFFGNFPQKDLVNAEVINPENYKKYSQVVTKLSIQNVKYYLKIGDEFIKNGESDKAKDSYLDARSLAKQLASFYSDLNNAFKGTDARIPNEMQRKGKETLQILAESNKRLADFYISDEKPEVAVPLLIETIRIMSPNSREGKEAYQKPSPARFCRNKI